MAPSRVGKRHVSTFLGSHITMDDAIAAIERWIERRTSNYICITGVHGVVESRKHCRLRDIHTQAGMVTPDGMPLVWMSRWLGARSVERVHGPDLMREVTARSPTRGYHHFYFGGGPQSRKATKARKILTTFSGAGHL